MAELLVETDVCIDHLAGTKRLPAKVASGIPLLPEQNSSRVLTTMTNRSSGDSSPGWMRYRSIAGLPKGRAFCGVSFPAYECRMP